jgi:hypothetical protein
MMENGAPEPERKFEPVEELKPKINGKKTQDSKTQDAR